MVSVVQVKSPDELDPEIFDCPCHIDNELALLIAPEIRASMLNRLGDKQERVMVYDFNPKLQNMAATVRLILDSIREESGRAMRPCLIAPYYFLKRKGMLAESWTLDPSPAGARVFANNYTLQDVKIKGCKSILDQVFCLLGLFDDDELNSCPFLAVKEGVRVIDMRFIPEKYRLDGKRAERIINESLSNWLEAVKDICREERGACR
jgi:hypothetical protein